LVQHTPSSRSERIAEVDRHLSETRHNIKELLPTVEQLQRFGAHHGGRSAGPLARTTKMYGAVQHFTSNARLNEPAGTSDQWNCYVSANGFWESVTMDGIIYLVGFIVIILFILSFLGLR